MVVSLHSNRTETKTVLFSSVLYPHPKFTRDLEFLAISYQQDSSFWAHFRELSVLFFSALEDSPCSQISSIPFIALVRPFIRGVSVLTKTIQAMQIKEYFW